MWDTFADGEAYNSWSSSWLSPTLHAPTTSSFRQNIGQHGALGAFELGQVCLKSIVKALFPGPPSHLRNYAELFSWGRHIDIISSKKIEKWGTMEMWNNVIYNILEGYLLGSCYRCIRALGSQYSIRRSVIHFPLARNVGFFRGHNSTLLKGEVSTNQYFYSFATRRCPFCWIKRIVLKGLHLFPSLDLRTNMGKTLLSRTPRLSHVKLFREIFAPFLPRLPLPHLGGQTSISFLIWKS